MGDSKIVNEVMKMDKRNLPVAAFYLNSVY